MSDLTVPQNPILCLRKQVVAAQAYLCCLRVAARLGKAPSKLSDTERTCWYSHWPVTDEWTSFCSDPLLTLLPHLLKCSRSLHAASLHPRDVMLILCHLEQTPQETHAKSSNNWKKIKGKDWKSFPCLFLCPGARWRYEKGFCLNCCGLSQPVP